MHNYYGKFGKYRKRLQRHIKFPVIKLTKNNYCFLLGISP